MTGYKPTNGGDWKEWSRYVLLELERLGDLLEKQVSSCSKIQMAFTKEIVELKEQQKVWPKLATAIPGIGALIIIVIEWFRP